MNLDLKYVVDFVIYRLISDGLTHLKLQKILYYIEAWYQGIYKTSIIENDFEAWVHGPVCREVFDRFKQNKGLYTLFSNSDIELTEQQIENYFSNYPQQREHILEVLNIYGGYTGNQLEQLTHQEAPWINARSGIPSNHVSCNIISKKDMQDYYKPLAS